MLKCKAAAHGGSPVPSTVRSQDTENQQWLFTEKIWRHWGEHYPTLQTVKFQVGRSKTGLTADVKIEVVSGNQLPSSVPVYQNECVAEKRFLFFSSSSVDECDGSGSAQEGGDTHPGLRMVTTPIRSISASWVFAAVEEPQR